MQNNKYTHNVKVYLKNNNNILQLNFDSEEKAREAIKLLHENDETFLSQKDNGDIDAFIKTSDISVVMYQQ